MKNKNNIRNIIIFCCIIGLFFFIKSRWISKSIFDFMVLSDMVEVKKSCYERRKTEVLDKVYISDYNDELYNFYISTYGDKICSYNNEELKMLIEKKNKELILENWEFVY